MRDYALRLLYKVRTQLENLFVGPGFHPVFPVKNTKPSHIRLLSIALIGSLATGAVFLAGKSFAQDKGASPTIKEIMKIANGEDKKNKVESLNKIVISGKGTHANADELLRLSKALASTTPPKGDLAHWRTRTEALVAAAEELDKGDKPSPAAIVAYKAAVDCKACHTEHKPPKKSTSLLISTPSTGTPGSIS